MIVLGLMSGTSLDGVDGVWIEINGKNQIKKKHHKYVAYPKKLRRELLLAAQGQINSHSLAELHHNLGRFYAKAFAHSKHAIDLVGLHGQTVYHRGQHATLQIGEPSYVSHALKAPVVYNFRAADIAMNGHGAPLAPFFHKHLIEHTKILPAAFHNLGGISNLTYYDGKNFLAFDTGPASILMDAWMESKTRGKKLFDKDGSTASQGLVDMVCLQNFLKYTYFKKTIPKSCGREEFNLSFIKKWGGARFLNLDFEDQMATLAELTAKTIANDYKKLPRLPRVIYFSGGGVHNKHLMKRLQIYMPGTQVSSSKDLGWEPEEIEAGAFAFLAYQRWNKIKIECTSITGGKKILLGQICEC